MRRLALALLLVAVAGCRGVEGDADADADAVELVGDAYADGDVECYTVDDCGERQICLDGRCQTID
jgi:hypothetical protein